MSLSIIGLGTAVPETKITRQHALAVAQRICPTAQMRERLEELHQHSGIENRYSALGSEVLHDILNRTRNSGSVFLPGNNDRGPTTAQRMHVYRKQAVSVALQACRNALAEANIAPSSITHLVTVSCTGFSAPGFDVGLIGELSLPRSVERTQVGFMGCHGALNGLRVARALAESERDACVLLCAVELCSLHYDYGEEMQKLVSNALFADGAAAVVGRADQTDHRWKVFANGSFVVPDSLHIMTWNIGDHGFDMTLSSRLPRLIEINLSGWLGTWLEHNGLAMSDVGSWAVHPGGPKILDAVQTSLKLPASALSVSRDVLAEYGNMSSPTIIFILERLRRERAPRPCVALGFGPGLTIEAAIIA